MNLTWLEPSVELSEGVHFQSYTLIGKKYKNCSTEYAAGFFPCIAVNFILRRELGYFVIQVTRRENLAK